MSNEPPKPEEKQFGLKPTELQMLKMFENLYFTQLSNFLSFIAMERLAYQVTQQTQFRVEDDKLFVSEKAETPKVEPASAGDVKEGLKNG